jgi:hypothetical protein
LTGDHPIHWTAIDGWIKSWGQGIWWPPYLEEVNAGLGSFWPVYYPPLYHVTCALGMKLGLSYWHAGWVMMALAHMLGASLCYGWLRSHMPSRAALWGALAYCLAPYPLLDVYHRGAFPEGIAMQFLPGVLWGCDLVRKTWNWRGALLGVTCFSTMVLCNLPATAVGLYGTGIYLAASALLQRRLGSFVRGLMVPLTGLGLTAFFWVPSWMDRALVSLPPTAILDNPLTAPFIHFRFPGDGLPTDAYDWCVHFQFLAIMMLGLLGVRRLHQAQQPFWLAALLLALAGTILSTEGAAWAYRLLPALASIQFPWRCLGMIAAGMAFLAGQVAVAWRRPPWVGVTCALLWMLFLATLWSNRELIAPGEMPLHGIPVIRNYVPVATMLPSEEQPPLPAVETTSPTARLEVQSWRPGQRVIASEAREDFAFLVRTYADPRWKAYDQNQRPLVTGTDARDPWKRLKIEVPGGTRLIIVQLERTRSACLGMAVTVATVASLLFVVWRQRRRGSVAGKKDVTSRSPRP